MGILLGHGGAIGKQPDLFAFCVEGHECSVDIDSIGLQLTVRQEPRGEQENLGTIIQVPAIVASAEGVCGQDGQRACESCNQRRISFLPTLHRYQRSCESHIKAMLE